MNATEAPGTIYCPASLIGILTDNKVEDIDYTEVESRLLDESKSIELDDEGLLSLWQKTGNLPNGMHDIQFTHFHEGVELEVFGEVFMNADGIEWHDLKAIDENNNVYDITFDCRRFNKYYMN